MRKIYFHIRARLNLCESIRTWAIRTYNYDNNLRNQLYYRVHELRELLDVIRPAITSNEYKKMAERLDDYIDRCVTVDILEVQKNESR